MSAPAAVECLAEVLEHGWANPEYKLLRVRAPPPASSAAPGQFFQLLCPTTADDAPFLRRPMSVYAADPQAGTVSFLYKITGAGTRGLATLEPGGFLDLFGPLGVGFHLDPAWRAIVLVGRGAGLATLAPLAQMAAAGGIGVSAILSARRTDLVLGADRLRDGGAEVIAVTDDNATSGPAHVERLLRGLIAERRADAFFTCGSARLLELLQRLAREFAIPGQVALEQQMACGLGMCFCCVRDFAVDGAVIHRRVCIEGPVFDLLEAVA